MATKASEDMSVGDGEGGPLDEEARFIQGILPLIFKGDYSEKTTGGRNEIIKKDVDEDKDEDGNEGKNQLLWKMNGGWMPLLDTFQLGVVSPELNPAWYSPLSSIPHKKNIHIGVRDTKNYERRWYTMS
ncbi:hypothetical protein Salat_2527500 [Sesamum alatum]|uniref:Uncharacterized protein n=1 Tax=Sesamum alatum TaxID=300844 RepID=A0AAE2CCI3_9LAMI|nr:hypothetical protein Salat_2527500 [Sesamum alatum]